MENSGYAKNDSNYFKILFNNIHTKMQVNVTDLFQYQTFKSYYH